MGELVPQTGFSVAQSEIINVPGANVIVRKILIVGDSQCRGATQIFNDYVGKEFSVETFVKPNALLLDVVSDLPCMTRNYCRNDFVLIVAGTNDVLSKRDLNRDLIAELAKGMSHTNVCILSVPILNNRPNLKDRINDFNRAMRETLSVINNNNIVWINLSDILRDDDMTQDTIHLTIAEKRRVVFHIPIQINYLFGSL